MAEKLYAAPFYEYPSKMKDHMTIIDQVQEPLLKTTGFLLCDTLVSTNQFIESEINKIL
jgi:hypothetical protein